MAHQRKEIMPNSCPQGRWTWNDQTKTLHFLSFDASDEIKGKKKKAEPTHLQERPSRRQERVYRRGRPQDQSKIAQGPLRASTASPKEAKTDSVTIEDVKQVALTLLQESESQSIPQGFFSLLRCQELDDFLAALLLYLSCCFEKKVLEMKPKPLLAEQIEADLLAMVEAGAKVELAKKQMAFHYSNLLLGLGLPQHHHMACGSFACLVAWVTFGRKELESIQEEVGRLLRSDTFNTVSRARGTNGQGSSIASSLQKQGETEVQEQTAPVPGRRRLRQRPALSRMVKQRSPLMVTLLPLPREAAPHLFVGSHPQRGPPALPCDPDALMEQLSSQLNSFCFGILGKPRSQFSSTTLKPQRMESGEEEEEEEEPEEEEARAEEELEEGVKLAEEVEQQEEEKGDEEEKDGEDEAGERVTDTVSSIVAQHPDEHSRMNVGIPAGELHSDRE